MKYFFGYIVAYVPQFLVVIYLLSGGLLLAEGYREFRSTDGMRIEAELMEASQTAITIRRQDGKVFKEVPLERFCSEDRRYVNQWLAQEKERINNADISADSKVKLLFLKGKDDEMNNYGDIDDRIVKFEPEVVLTSEEKLVTYPDVEGTIVVVGQGIIEDEQYTILSKQNFSITVLPKQKSRWEGEAFECRYDPGYGGFEYGGYLLVLRNRDGRIVMAKASKSHWEKDPRAILNARKLQGYDSKFEKKIKLYTTFGIPR
ncbi:MAG: hypothetical protein GWO81_03840 [Verrucomicrobia bacterium]|nr:hypothetical protein [Verrucomicrobiota bacterium]